MAHSYVEFHGRHVLLKDNDIELAAHFIIDQRNNAFRTTPVPAEVDRLLDWWRDSISTAGSGCIQLELDKYLSTPESIRAVVELIDGAIRSIRELGEVVSADYQNRILGDNLVMGERRSDSIIAILEQMKSVLLWL